MKKLFFYWSRLVSTFWFVPFLIIVLAILAAFFAVSMDIRFDFQLTGTGKYIFISNASSARSVLSIISGAMIGVAGTVFSITLVVLTLASSQLGPRLIGNFMYDRLNQIVLGSYVATFIYSLIVLNAIKEGGEQAFIPALSIMLAILAALSNIFLLIIYIHHTAISIQADRVISKVSSTISSNIYQLFPKKEDIELEPSKAIELESILESYPNKIKLTSSKQGYIQYIDHDALLNLAVEKDLIIELRHKAGEFLINDGPMAKVYSKNPTDEIQKDIATNIITGKTRTQQQDAEYTIHQVVEIASRALSPGINDPFTAISCIDNLTSTLAYLTKVEFPSKYRFDGNNKLRVITEQLTFEGMLDAAYNQIRQFATGSPSVLIRLMEALVALYRIAQLSDQKIAISQHARMTLTAGEKHFYEKNDLKDLQDRYDKINESD